MDAISGKKRPLEEKRRHGAMQPESVPDEKRMPHEVRFGDRPGEVQISGEAQPEAKPEEKRMPEKMRRETVPEGKQPNSMPDSGRLAARLREETAELLALLPAARKAAAGGPAGGEAALDGIARAAYRVLRIAENMEACAALASGTERAVPICVTALAAAYVNGAAGVCRTAVFQPEWPREPLWSLGCARLFAAALGNLLANAVQYGGERPFISVRARKSGMILFLTVADNGTGYPAFHEAGDGLGLTVARRYAETFGGQLLANSVPGLGARFTLCLPLCTPGRANPPRAQEIPDARQTPFAPPLPPDYMADRFSPLYVQLAPVCDLPL